MPLPRPFASWILCLSASALLAACGGEEPQVQANPSSGDRVQSSRERYEASDEYKEQLQAAQEEQRRAAASEPAVAADLPTDEPTPGASEPVEPTPGADPAVERQARDLLGEFELALGAGQLPQAEAVLDTLRSLETEHAGAESDLSGRIEAAQAALSTARREEDAASEARAVLVDAARQRAAQADPDDGRIGTEPGPAAPALEK